MLRRRFWKMNGRGRSGTTDGAGPGGPPPRRPPGMRPAPSEQRPAPVWVRAAAHPPLAGAIRPAGDGARRFLSPPSRFLLGRPGLTGPADSGQKPTPAVRECTIDGHERAPFEPAERGNATRDRAGTAAQRPLPRARPRAPEAAPPTQAGLDPVGRPALPGLAPPVLGAAPPLAAARAVGG